MRNFNILFPLIAFDLVGFYGMPNPVYTCILNIYDL